MPVGSLENTGGSLGGCLIQHKTEDWTASPVPLFMLLKIIGAVLLYSH